MLLLLLYYYCCCCCYIIIIGVVVNNNLSWYYFVLFALHSCWKCAIFSTVELIDILFYSIALTFNDSLRKSNIYLRIKRSKHSTINAVANSSPQCFSMQKKTWRYRDTTKTEVSADGSSIHPSHLVSAFCFLFSGCVSLCEINLNISLNFCKYLQLTVHLNSYDDFKILLC